MSSVKLSKKLGKLVNYTYDLKEIVLSPGIHTGELSGSYTLNFENGSVVVRYIGGNHPQKGQTLGRSLRAMGWTIKEIINKSVISFK